MLEQAEAVQHLLDQVIFQLVKVELVVLEQQQVFQVHLQLTLVEVVEEDILLVKEDQVV
jgi:hypothetical protein